MSKLWSFNLICFLDKNKKRFNFIKDSVVDKIEALKKYKTTTKAKMNRV